MKSYKPNPDNVCDAHKEHMIILTQNFAENMIIPLETVSELIATRATANEMLDYIALAYNLIKPQISKAPIAVNLNTLGVDVRKFHFIDSLAGINRPDEFEKTIYSYLSAVDVTQLQINIRTIMIAMQRTATVAEMNSLSN